MSENRFHFLNNLFTILMNFLVVAWLFIAMYRASLYPDDFNVTFFETFFSLLIPTLLLGFFGKRYLHRRRPLSVSAQDAPLTYEL